MTTQTNTETEEIIAKWAAEVVECTTCLKAEECPICQGYDASLRSQGLTEYNGRLLCTKCIPTGTVPRFPTLRVDCLSCGYSLKCPEKGVWWGCHGLGYTIPPQDQWLKLGIEMVHELGYRTIVFNPGFMSFPCVHIESSKLVDGVVGGRGGDDTHNLWHALDKLDQALAAQVT